MRGYRAMDFGQRVSDLLERLHVIDPRENVELQAFFK
jgi:hypothetical protein